MSQILTNIEGILKDKYQPALSNLINTEPSPFLEMIRKEPLTNNKVRVAAPIGINGGFGFGEEGVGTPAAAAQKYVTYELKAVDMYVDIGVSNKTMVLGSSDQGAMINALDAEVKGSYAAAKWNLSRALFGDGSGYLTSTIPGSTEQDTFSVYDTKNLIEGLVVDLYMLSNETSKYELEAEKVRIKRVDHENFAVTFERALTLPSTCMVYVQGSRDRELTGLGAIFCDVSEQNHTLYGLDRRENTWLVPEKISLQSAPVTDLILYRGIRQAKNRRGAKIDLLMMGDIAFESYQQYMDTHTTHVIERRKFVGGATGYSILVGDQEVVIINESKLPEREIWGVDTQSFILQQTPWEFVSNGGSIFTLQANSSVFRALLASYGNLICTNPGGCVRFVECGSY